MTLLAEMTARGDRVRVDSELARQAIAQIIGHSATDAIVRLRFGPGRTCEAVARVLETATARAERGGVDPNRLMVTSGDASPAEDIVRVRRKFHGKADWISSPTADIVIELQPKGLVESRLTADGPTAIERTPRRVEQSPTTRPQGSAAATKTREALLEVLDPDLGINIVDLGFVRGLIVDEAGTAVITMTLTSAACPIADVMEDQIRTVLKDLEPVVRDFRINWEWFPSWRPADVTEDGKEQLRAIGFSI